MPPPADSPYVAFYVAFYVTPQKRTLAVATGQKDSNPERSSWTVARLNVKVVPGSSRDQIVGWLGDALKIKVTAPPDKGKANKAVIDLLAETLGIPAADIQIKSGHSSPSKVVTINGMDDEAIKKAFGQEDSRRTVGRRFLSGGNSTTKLIVGDLVVVLICNLDGMPQPLSDQVFPKSLIPQFRHPTRSKVLVQLGPWLDARSLQDLDEAGTEIRLGANRWLQNEFTIFRSLCSPCLQLPAKLRKKGCDAKFLAFMTLRFLAAHKNLAFRPVDVSPSQ
jgi:uncharacterized protein